MKPRFVRAALVVALTCEVTAAPSRASAQTAAEKGAAAQVLFDDAMALMKEGKAAEACPKLEESQRLDPGMGTQFRLAECYEQTGRLASAWSLFVEVADAAKREGLGEREAQARQRAEALKPKVPQLTISVPVPVAGTPGLAISRNGAAVGQPLWSRSIPVDPGEHVVVASAPGKKNWQRKVSVAEASVAELAVPPLEDAPVASAAPEAAPDKSGGDGSGRRVLGLVAGGVGLVGIGVGSVFGLRALSKQSDAEPHCRAGNLCSAEGIALQEEGVAAGNVSTIAFVAGGVLLGAGAVLYFTAPSPDRVGARTAPRVGVGPRGVVVAGSF